MLRMWVWDWYKHRKCVLFFCIFVTASAKNMSTKRAKINFIASVKEDRLEDIKQIAEQLKALGCDITNILSFSGIITGETIAKLTLSDLKIEGIQSVELERIVKVQ
jgi:hypothetical protein